MTFLWDNRDALNRAARQPAQVAPSTFWENAGASFDVAEAEDTMVSETIMMSRAWTRYLHQVEELTGERLPNPDVMKAATAVPDPVDLIGDGMARAMGYDYWAWSSEGRYQAAASTVLQRVRRLAAENPDLEIPVKTEAELVADAAAEAAQRRERLARVSAGADGWGVAGQMAGAMGALTADPLVALTLPMGAPASAGVLRGAMIDAGLAAGIVGLTQPKVADWKSEIGVDYGWRDAAANVAAAAGGTAVLSATIRSAGALYGRIRPRAGQSDADALADARVAEHVIERELAISEVAPVADATGRDAHAARLDATARALSEGEPLPDPLPNAAARGDDELKDIWRRWNATREDPVPEVPDGAAIAARAELQRRGWTLRGEGWHAPKVDGQAAPRGALPHILRRPDVARPQRFHQYLKTIGGLKDDAQDYGGWLRRADYHRQVPGLVNNSNGRQLDEAAHRAWEDGWFPEMEGRPTIQDLMDRLDEDLTGRPVYRADESDAAQAWDDWRTMTAEVERMGVDARGMSDDELVDAMAVAHAREAWEPHSQSMPLSTDELRAIAREARETGRDVQDVADEYAETRAQIFEAVTARFDSTDDDIPFDWDDGPFHEQHARMVEDLAPQRGRDAEIAALDNPDMLVPVPTGHFDEAGNMVFEHRRAGDVWDELDAEDVLARQVEACAIGVAAE